MLEVDKASSASIPTGAGSADISVALLFEELEAIIESSSNGLHVATDSKRRVKY